MPDRVSLLRLQKFTSGVTYLLSVSPRATLALYAISIFISAVLSDRTGLTEKLKTLAPQALEGF